MNISPLGPFLQETLGKMGFAKLGPAALGVSATKSVPEQSSVSPQMCRRLRKWPTSCVAVRPRLNGACAVPFVPNPLWVITTPSVSAGPPGNCAYPRSPPPRLHTQRFRYLSVGHGALPSAADFTE